MRSRWIILLLFIACYALIFFRWVNVSIYDNKTEARVGIYGDAFSSRNVHSAAMWFSQVGFSKTKGLPVFNYEGNLNQSGVEVYTHYPPLPDILAGIYARVLDNADPRVLSAVIILLSMVFFLFLLKALQTLVPGEKAALISWIALVSSAYFLCWADDLHQHLYTELLKWVFTWLLYRYYTESKKRWMLPVLCGIYFVQSLLSFEPIPFLAILTIGFSVIFQKRFLTRTNFLLLAMPVLGVGLHLVQNRLYFGNWNDVFADLENAFLKRTRGKGEWDNELGRAVEGKDMWRMWKSEIWFRIGRMFSFSAIPLIVVTAFALANYYSKHRPHFKMAILFLIAGIAWIFVMPQHALIHTFTIKHLGLFVGFVSGYGFLAYYKVLVKHLREKKFIWWPLHLAFIAWTLFGFASNQLYYVWLKFGFAYPFYGTDANLW